MAAIESQYLPGKSFYLSGNSEDKQKSESSPNFYNGRSVAGLSPAQLSKIEGGGWNDMGRVSGNLIPGSMVHVGNQPASQYRINSAASPRCFVDGQSKSTGKGQESGSHKSQASAEAGGSSQQVGRKPLYSQILTGSGGSPGGRAPDGNPYAKKEPESAVLILPEEEGADKTDDSDKGIQQKEKVEVLQDSPRVQQTELNHLEHEENMLKEWAENEKMYNDVDEGCGYLYQQREQDERERAGMPDCDQGEVFLSPEISNEAEIDEQEYLGHKYLEQLIKDIENKKNLESAIRKSNRTEDESGPSFNDLYNFAKHRSSKYPLKTFLV